MSDRFLTDSDRGRRGNRDACASRRRRHHGNDRNRTEWRGAGRIRDRRTARTTLGPPGHRTLAPTRPARADARRPSELIPQYRRPPGWHAPPSIGSPSPSPSLAPAPAQHVHRRPTVWDMTCADLVPESHRSRNPGRADSTKLPPPAGRRVPDSLPPGKLRKIRENSFLMSLKGLRPGTASSRRGGRAVFANLIHPVGRKTRKKCRGTGGPGAEHTLMHAGKHWRRRRSGSRPVGTPRPGGGDVSCRDAEKTKTFHAESRRRRRHFTQRREEDDDVSRRDAERAETQRKSGRSFPRTRVRMTPRGGDRNGNRFGSST